MKNWFLLGSLPLAALLLGLVGCDDHYSDAVRYLVRQDPIPMQKIGEELLYPDQPGQFPLLTAGDFLDVRNPYFKNNQELKEKTNKDLVSSGTFRDPALISAADRKVIQASLDKLYGTPARPTVAGLEEDDKNFKDLLKLSDDMLLKGSRAYRIHCLHCHGVTGDGRGPTARWVNPHPRDYRPSRFKFQSVNQTGGQIPPHRDDILRVLEIGIEGTAMPSFVVLPLAEREALASYVIHLSIRGKTEFDTIFQHFDYDSQKNTLIANDVPPLDEAIPLFHQNTVKKWVAAQDQRIEVVPNPYTSGEAFKASAKRGMTYFMGTDPEIKKILGENACVTCHKDFGRQSTFRYDEWGTLAKPNNLTQGIYRGGRRPVDIYHRIHSGILPSGMIAFGKVLPGEEKIWDLVNFVQVLGNPNMRKSVGIVID